MLPGSHPHAGRNPTENECGGIHRISQREKQFDDFSTTRESEVQIWESIILVQRVLRGHRRKEYEKDRGTHSKSVERRSTYKSDDVKGIHGTTVDTLVKLNGIKNKNLINIGQVIKLP